MRPPFHPILLSLVVLAGLLTHAKTAPNPLEEQPQRASRWDDETAERFFRKGGWREGIAYLGRALRLDPQNAAAARHLWSAVVSGGGDSNTLPDLVLRQPAQISVAVFSPDGQRILTAGADKTACLWDATTGALVGEPMRHEDEIIAAVFSPDGARIATASKDGTARLWDAATSKLVGEPMRHGYPLNGVAFNSSGTRIVTECDEAGVVRLWDGVTGAAVGEALPHRSSDGTPATFSPDGKLLTTLEGGSLRHWDTVSGRISGKPLRLPPGIERTLVSPDRKRAVTIGGGKAQVWSMTTGRCVGTLHMKNSVPIKDAEFSPDGTRIVTLAERSGQVWDAGQLWDAETGKPVGEVLTCRPTDAEGGHKAIFSPDSRYVLLSSSESNLVRAWNCETGEPYSFFSSLSASDLRHPEEVLEVFFTADGMRIVTTCQDHFVRVWDAQTGALIGQPLRHGSREGPDLESTAVSADGTRLLTVDSENTVRVWHVDAWGKPPGELLSQDVRDALLHAQPSLAEPLPQDPVEAQTPPMLTGAGLPPAFVEALSGYRFTDDGALGEIPESEWAALRGQLRRLDATESAWSPLIGWWLASPVERPLSPGATLKRRERSDQLLVVGLEAEKLLNTPALIDNAYLIDPTHPLIHIALAGLAYGQQGDFLRAYGIARLPADPAIRARAAKMLIDQKQPDLARKVIGARPVK